MKRRVVKKIAIGLFLLGIFLSLVGGFNLTGNVLGDAGLSINLFKIWGLAFVLISIVLLSSKKVLSAIFIPKEENNQESITRARKFINEYHSSRNRLSKNFNNSLYFTSRK